MAQRKTWQVQLGGGIDAQYTVLGADPLEAGQRAWRLDSAHQSHGVRHSLLVQLAGTFEDVEDDIPANPEAELRARVDDLVARVQTLESRSTTTSGGARL